MLKKMAVGTVIGAWANEGRHRWGLVEGALRRSSTLGTEINDYYAGELVSRLCQNGSVFVDVGAHIGSVIDAVSRNSKPVKIIAFEAVPEKAAALARKFKSVEVHPVALGPERGDAAFYVDDDRPGYSSLNEAAERSLGTRKIRVPICPLDDFTASEAVDLIKIDVEGAELGVLIGTARTIEHSLPTIMFESGAETMGDYTKSAMWQWLHARDYAVLLPTRVPHFDSGMSLAAFEEAHLYPRITTNYFAVHRSRRAEVMHRARAVLNL